MNWQIQQAEQSLSEVIKHASQDGPQLLTLHGEAVAWIISAKDYKKPLKQENIVDFFQHSPHTEIDLKIERRKDLPRKIDL